MAGQGYYFHLPGIVDILICLTSQGVNIVLKIGTSKCNNNAYPGVLFVWPKLWGTPSDTHYPYPPDFTPNIFSVMHQ